MFRYSGYGLTIDSELELPELAPSESEPDVVIRLGSERPERRQATLDDEVEYNMAGAATFHVRQGREIWVFPNPTATPALLRVPLLGRVMAFLLRQRGWIPLHGSAVSINDQTVLFLGRSGEGKSTAAAAFHKAGHSVISDDVCAVRRIDGTYMLQAVGPRIRLLADSISVLDGLNLNAGTRTDKTAFDLSPQIFQQVLPVRNIYVLAYGDNFRIENIAPAEAVAMLGTCSFVLRGRADSEVLRSHLSNCAALASVISIRRLTRPRSLELLPEMVRLVERDLTGAVNPGSPTPTPSG